MGKKTFNQVWNTIYMTPPYQYGERYSAKLVAGTKWFDVFDLSTERFVNYLKCDAPERKEIHENINKIVKSLNIDHSIYLYEVYKYLNPINP